VNGGRVNGGRVNGGRVNGGRVNGGRVNGGRVNGGRVNGGLVNGSSLLYATQVRARRRRSARRTAVLLALLVFAVAIFSPLVYYGIFGPEPITVDGAFGDWAGVPAVPDSPTDQTQNDDVNLVAFASTQGSRDLFFYFQVASTGRPFLGAQTPPVAESFRLLIDRDRSQATGYLAHGLGVDYIVELTGYDGRLRESSVRVFPSGANLDRTDVSGFSTAGAVRAIQAGNQIEASVPLIDLGGSGASGLPFLLALAEDSRGRIDLGDAVFSSAPGVLALTQTPSTLGTLPPDRDSLLLSIEGRPYHQNITLEALVLSVDGDGGGGVSLSYATFGGRNLTLNVGAAAGANLRLNLTGAGPFTFSLFSPPAVLNLFGRATGPQGVGSLRVAVNGSEFALAGPPPPGTSGHASVFPPLAFERAYVGAAPPSIRIDGAFADWGPVRPFDPDADDDVLVGEPTPLPGGTNVPAVLNQNIDIRESRADVNTGAAQVSFMATVDGALMAGRLLAFPEYPRPTQPSTGGGGGGGGGAPAVSGDLATVYIDTDLNPTTGWVALPGLGVDAVLEVEGRGGGYGRTPFTTQTSLAFWDALNSTFNRTVRPVPVGYSSSKLETQVASIDLCPTLCARVRYAFFLKDTSDQVDRTSGFAGNFRGDGEALYFEEAPPRTRIAYQGDRAAPALSFSLSSPPTNTRSAEVLSLLARLDGVLPADIERVALYADRQLDGALDRAERDAGPLAEGTLAAGGYATLSALSNLTLAPGSRLDGLLTVDIAANAAAPAWLNASIARVGSITATGIADIRFALPTESLPLRILRGSAIFRGQNQLVVNEVSLVGGWIEVLDTTGASTNLSSPSIMGLRVYSTNNNGNNVQNTAIFRISGTTNSDGFASFNASVPYSTTTRRYYVGLWCANCTAGQNLQGTNNATLVDWLEMPRTSSNGAWGRYPDGTAAGTNTTNDTRDDFNALPGGNNTTADPSGQSNLVVNEVNIASDWVEIVSSTFSAVNLTWPATMGLRVYSTNNAGGNVQTSAIILLSGTTNAGGFAAFNITVPYSSTTRRYHVGLWCSNCTAGKDFRGRNNRTYVSDVELPQNASEGVWGRYPDANGTFVNTTNTTRASTNEIPEFGEVAVPVLSALASVLLVRARKRPRERHPLSPSAPAAP